MPSTAPLQGPYHAALSGHCAQAIIFLHGYGADGNDLIGLAPYFAQTLPDAAFYAPNAPEPCEIAPYGRQWFSLERYDADLLRRHPETLAAAFENLYAGALDAAPALDSYIDTVCAREGLTLDKVALVGFSQGTMMALHVGLRRGDPAGHRLAGIVGFSGVLVGASRLAEEAVEDAPPVVLIHGDADPVVPFVAMTLSEDALTAAGIANDSLRCPGLEHGISDAGIARATEFLKSVL
jgi:phospholipase/carboxylesterase